MQCKICGSPCSPFGTATILGRHTARYERCDACGFLAIADVTWLEEAYSEAIADVDIGPINRMIDLAWTTKTLLHAALDPDGRYLDYGAGYGAFVRRMRDLGYDFRWYDKHCANLFAKSFEASMDATYGLLTAFEVMEHLEDPLAELDAMTRLSRNLFFSTSLIGKRPPPLHQWAYYAPETGQHIAFYTKESLRIAARRFGLHYVTNDVDLHLISEKPVTERLFRFITRRKVSHILGHAFRRDSLLERDYLEGRARALDRQDGGAGDVSRRSLSGRVAEE